MQRIAVLSIHTCPLASLGGRDTGGMNVYIREIGREIGNRNISVDIFTRSQKKDIPKIVQFGDRSRIIHITAGPVTSLNKYLLWDQLETFVKGVLSFTDEEGLLYDLIHSHYWLSGIAAEKLKACWNVPFVHMYHTLGLIKNMVAKERREEEKPRRIQAERSIAASADGIVAASPLERAQLKWYYDGDPARIEVIPCGVDPSRFRPVETSYARMRLGLSERKWILYVGRILPIKGIDTLIKALSIGIKRGAFSADELGCLIVGGDFDQREVKEERDRLSKLAQELDVLEMVHFMGHQSHDHLPYFYSASDVCVIPSRYESFGMVALEAMACGTPVIASKVGGLPYIIRDGATGFAIPEGDPSAMWARIEEILTESGLKDRLGREARRQAIVLEWSVIVDRLLDFFKRVRQGVGEAVRPHADDSRGDCDERVPIHHR